MFQILGDLHQGMTDADSVKPNARLILILANHIGDETVIRKATAVAKDGLEPSLQDVITQSDATTGADAHPISSRGAS